ncbi:DegV family protein [Youxingia wuxianensis]|uniref:DegV family protein n=1 Tax=Youxingia wuxianensis TaxID=2763678 RepID=A0A926EL00_9FIRM|nr:DegV family protein [Youxingia wuxianensis]MBC8585318.1 DegV family protein [Youxingia wuxianensis]
MSEEKILLMTDTASDIADEDLIASEIMMLPIPITIDGQGYLERMDFTTEEFYDRLAASKELPVTSHISSFTYEQAYKDAFERGYTHVINVTITSEGSNMFVAAVTGKRQFFEEHPEAVGKMEIKVLDSGSYTLGYGYPLVEAAKMNLKGAGFEQIVDYLEDFFSTVEIHFAPYSLEYAKRSGRIPVAAAFVGDMLGLRPIISIIDGKTTIVEKVRGDKNLIPRILDYARSRCVDKDAPTAIVCGCDPTCGDDAFRQAKKVFGHKPKAIYQAGASIAINAGPKVVGIIVRGAKRVNTRMSEKKLDTLAKEQ